MGPQKAFSVEQIKTMRVETDALYQKMKSGSEAGGEYEGLEDGSLYGMSEYMVMQKLIEAKMWMGKMLEGIGSTLPAEFADKSTNTTNN